MPTGPANNKGSITIQKSISRMSQSPGKPHFIQLFFIMATWQFGQFIIKGMQKALEDSGNRKIDWIKYQLI